jgi:methylmalonyl-CoA/ethylmalonyl-CoA epimerase
MKLEHVGIAVKSLEQSIEGWKKMGGFKSVEITQVDSQKVKVAIIDTGDVKVELIEPLSENSSIARFLEKKGEGLHHLCFEVADIKSVLLSLKRAGIKLIDESPREGAFGKEVAFIHPSSAGGVLVEISEEK